MRFLTMFFFVIVLVVFAVLRWLVNRSGPAPWGIQTAIPGYAPGASSILAMRFA